MPSPIFHSIAAIGAVVGSLPQKKRFPWKLCTLLVVVSNIPDLDLIPGIFFGLPAMQYHHGFTHSFGFALAIALLLSAVPFKDTRWTNRFLLLLAVALSHPIFDLFTDMSEECSQALYCGQPLAWPLLAKKWDPILPVFGALKMPVGFSSWLMLSNLLSIALETGYALLCFMSLWLAGITYRSLCRSAQQT